MSKSTELQEYIVVLRIGFSFISTFFKRMECFKVLMAILTFDSTKKYLSSNGNIMCTYPVILQNISLTCLIHIENT